MPSGSANLRPRWSAAGVLCLLLSGGFALPVGAASWWAHPTTGSGTACTQGSPCTLSQALASAQSGDEVVLMDGTFTPPSGGKSTTFKTVRAGVTIRAQNYRQAIVGMGSNSYKFIVSHSNTTVRGIRFAGNSNGRALDITGGSSDSLGNNISNIVLEDNTFENSYSACLGIISQVQPFDITGLIIRRNLMSNCGMNNVGEGMYVNSFDLGGTIFNLEVYQNTLQGFTCDGIDIRSVHNADIHHNLWQNQVRRSFCNPDDILTIQAGQFINFHDNIGRNSAEAGQGPMRISWSGGHHIYNNVFHNIPGSASVKFMSPRFDSNSTQTEVNNNTFCSTPTTTVSYESGTSTANVHNNNFNRPQGECDAEVTRITNEMNTPTSPTVTACTVNNAAPTHLIVDHSVPTPPLLPSTNPAGYSGTKAGSAWTVSSGTRSDNDTYDLTMASPAAAGETICLSYAQATGNVTNSATPALEVAETSCFGCTNNVTPPASATVTQVDYACSPSNTLDRTALPWSGLTNVPGWCDAAPGHNLRVRLSVGITGQAVTSAWRPIGTDGGEYPLQDMNADGTCPGGKKLCFGPDALPHEVLSNVLPLGGQTFAACGEFLKVGASTQASCTIAGGQRTEFEFAIHVSETATGTATLGIERSTGTDPDAVTNPLTVTIVAPSARF